MKLLIALGIQIHVNWVALGPWLSLQNFYQFIHDIFLQTGSEKSPPNSNHYITNYRSST